MNTNITSVDHLNMGEGGRKGWREGRIWAQNS